MEGCFKKGKIMVARKQQDRSAVDILAFATRIPELRRRLLVVVAVFVVYVIGLHIPIPGVDHAAVRRIIGGGGTLFGLLDVFSGGALRSYTLFAMGLTPYIDASIVGQLLLFAVPTWQKQVRDGGENGRKEFSKKTRILALVVAVLQSSAATYLMHVKGAIAGGIGTLTVDVVMLCAGTAFLMWLGEIVTTRGIGNGVSLLIFCGIMVRLPSQLGGIAQGLAAGSIAPWQGLVLGAAFVIGLAAIVQISLAQRRIPIRHTRKMPGGSSDKIVSYLPLRLNGAGVIPIVFAASLQLLPSTIALFLGEASPTGSLMRRLSAWLMPGHNPVSWLVYAALVMFFTYFYTAVSVNVDQIADDFKTYGSFIPGIRPGKSTRDYLDRVATRVTLAGALFLAAVALMQYAVPAVTNAGMSVIGGTSLLIVVGVALDTFQAIEAQLSMRHYQPFIR